MVLGSPKMDERRNSVPLLFHIFALQSWAIRQPFCWEYYHEYPFRPGLRTEGMGGILVLNRQFSWENWTYVHSAIPNALLDNIPDRLLVYLYDAMNLLIHGDAHEKSCKFVTEMIIHNIKVSQTPIFFEPWSTESYHLHSAHEDEH